MTTQARRFALLAALSLAACGGSSTPASSAGGAPAAAKKLVEIDVAALKSAREAGPITLIDVRTPEEFASGHVPGAVNLPVDDLQARMGELAAHKTGDLYLICRSGARSGRAQGMLASAGYANPINIAGGTLAWKSAGYPVE